MRKANGNYLPWSRNILNFCSNLPAHTLSDIDNIARQNVLYLSTLNLNERRIS
jgi:hypothetical protein